MINCHLNEDFNKPDLVPWIIYQSSKGTFTDLTIIQYIQYMSLVQFGPQKLIIGRILLSWVTFAQIKFARITFD